MISTDENDVPTTRWNHLFVISTGEFILLYRQTVESLLVISTEELFFFVPISKYRTKEWLCAAFNGWLLCLMVLYATTKSG